MVLQSAHRRIQTSVGCHSRMCIYSLWIFKTYIRVNRFNTIRLIKYILTLSLLLFFFIAKNSISFCTNPLVFRSYRGACAVLLCRHTILQLWILGRSCDVHMPIRDSYIRFYSFVICQTVKEWFMINWVFKKEEKTTL